MRTAGGECSETVERPNWGGDVQPGEVTDDVGSGNGDGSGEKQINDKCQRPDLSTTSRGSEKTYYTVPASHRTLPAPPYPAHRVAQPLRR